jgi:hypothetical protein
MKIKEEDLGVLRVFKIVEFKKVGEFIFEIMAYNEKIRITWIDRNPELPTISWNMKDSKITYELKYPFKWFYILQSLKRCFELLKVLKGIKKNF